MQEPLQRSLDSSSRPAQRDVTLIAPSVKFQKRSTKAILSPSGPTIAHCIPKLKSSVSIIRVDYKKSLLYLPTMVPRRLPHHSPAVIFRTTYYNLDNYAPALSHDSCLKDNAAVLPISTHNPGFRKPVRLTYPPAICNGKDAYVLVLEDSASRIVNPSHDLTTPT
ncbi:hypothetical protein GGP41_009548 [Bipolaris sorokiniana]|uniref:Uncharacterized protein n=1 Tax=Cochliobolus sativus TaxID=45130 RepID=A0A8H5ZD49_COCSA|nr:hypothetical protein GGP41_009548 [Bipolaris sorokiniana]